MAADLVWRDAVGGDYFSAREDDGDHRRRLGRLDSLHAVAILRCCHCFVAVGWLHGSQAQRRVAIAIFECGRWSCMVLLELGGPGPGHCEESTALRSGLDSAGLRSAV